MDRSGARARPPGGARRRALRRRDYDAGRRLSDAGARLGRGGGHFGLAQFIRRQRNQSLLPVGAETRRRSGTGDRTEPGWGVGSGEWGMGSGESGIGEVTSLSPIPDSRLPTSHSDASLGEKYLAFLRDEVGS